MRDDIFYSKGSGGVVIHEYYVGMPQLEMVDRSMYLGYGGIIRTYCTRAKSTYDQFYTVESLLEIIRTIRKQRASFATEKGYLEELNKFQGALNFLKSGGCNKLPGILKGRPYSTKVLRKH